MISGQTPKQHNGRWYSALFDEDSAGVHFHGVVVAPALFRTALDVKRAITEALDAAVREDRDEWDYGDVLNKLKERGFEYIQCIDWVEGKAMSFRTTCEFTLERVGKEATFSEADIDVLEELYPDLHDYFREEESDGDRVQVADDMLYVIGYDLSDGQICDLEGAIRTLTSCKPGAFKLEVYQHEPTENNCSGRHFVTIRAGQEVPPMRFSRRPSHAMDEFVEFGIVNNKNAGNPPALMVPKRHPMWREIADALEGMMLPPDEGNDGYEHQEESAT
jgi:hypothetical protein